MQYRGDDEVGRLASTFKRLADHMKEHINDLNKRVYVDALTSVKNKGAFSTAIDSLQKQVDEEGGQTAFAIGVFDCDDLKSVNDQYGHDKGDIYLKTACRLICRIFDHSPVFRIGGDEFAVILRNQDYENREQLVSQFERERERINADSENRWKQIHIAMGIAVFDADIDSYVIDTVRRADKIMYADKQARKQAR
ncbi:MAG: GGDEF domain-containing protein [Clostridia bacterium]|nr:GGDEF domain-containing protein [Clostridia bacterium]